MSGKETPDGERLTRWNQINHEIADGIYRRWGGLTTLPSKDGYAIEASDGDGNPLPVPDIPGVAPELDASLKRIAERGFKIASNTGESPLRATLFGPGGERVASSNLQLWSFSEVVTYFDEESKKAGKP